MKWRNLLKSDKVKELEIIIEDLRYDKLSLQQTVDLQMETVEEQTGTIQKLQQDLKKARHAPVEPITKQDILDAIKRETNE